MVLIALATFAMVEAVLGVWLGCQQSKLLLRTFSVAAASLRCIVLGLALLAWLYSLQARPFVFRAANLICQDVRAWNCTGSETTAANWKPTLPTAGSRRLLFAGMHSQPLDTPSVSMANIVASSLPAPLPRRLGPAETAI